MERETKLLKKQKKCAVNDAFRFIDKDTSRGGCGGQKMKKML